MNGDLPAGWESRESRSSGKPYYYNSYTGGTQWDKPSMAGSGQVSERNL